MIGVVVSLANSVGDQRQLVAAVGGDQEGDGAAPHPSAEWPKSRSAPGFQVRMVPSRSVPSDGIVRGLDDGCELEELLLGPSGLGNVAQPDSQDLFLSHLEFGNRCFSGEFGAVLSQAEDHPSLVHGPQDVRRGGKALDVPRMARHEPLREQDVQRPAQTLPRDLLLPSADDRLCPLQPTIDAAKDYDTENIRGRPTWGGRPSPLKDGKKSIVRL